MLKVLTRNENIKRAQAAVSYFFVLPVFISRLFARSSLLVDVIFLAGRLVLVKFLLSDFSLINENTRKCVLCFNLVGCVGI